MSARAKGHAFDSALPYNEKWVLVIHADAADHYGRNIQLSASIVAHISGYSVSAVRAIRKQLIDKGILKLAGKGEEGINVYDIILENIPPLPPFRLKHNSPDPYQNLIGGLNEEKGTGVSDSDTIKDNKNNKRVNEANEEVSSDITPLEELMILFQKETGAIYYNLNQQDLVDQWIKPFVVIWEKAEKDFEFTKEAILAAIDILHRLKYTIASPASIQLTAINYIKQKTAIDPGDDYTTALAAYEAVSKLAASYGRKIKPRIDDEITRNIIDDIGWTTFCNMSKTSAQKLFVFKYREVTNEHNDD